MAIDYAVEEQMENIRQSGPDMNTPNAAHALGYSVQYVLKLANSGRLPGWVKREDAPGYERKIGARKDRREVLFDSSDVEAYKREHTRLTDEELKELILHYGMPEMQAKGYVTRTRVRDLLVQNHKQSDRVYYDIKRIAQEMGWPSATERKK